MIGLLAALTFASGVVPPTPIQVGDRFFSHPRVRCLGSDTQKVGSASIGRVSRLGDLPAANMEIAVNRLNPNGCPAPVVVSYNVGR
jgi:hypothetical protein